MSELSEGPRTKWGHVVVAAIVSALFTVGGTVAAYYLTAKPTKLTYSTTRGPALSSAEGFRSIYLVSVTDAGKTEVDSVACAVTLAVGKIEDARARIDAAIPITESKSPNEYRITVPSLNPGEGFSLGLMLQTPNENDQPQVSIRAKGVVAERSDQQSPVSKGEKQPYVIAATGAMLGMFSYFILLLLRGKPSSITELFRSGPFDRNEIVAHILGATGLHDQAERVRFAPSEMSYMGSADYIFGIATRDESKRARCVLALRGLLLVDAIASSSVRVITRNLQRLEGSSFDAASVGRIRAEAKTLKDDTALRNSIDKLVADSLAPAPEAGGAQHKTAV